MPSTMTRRRHAGVNRWNAGALIDRWISTIGNAGATLPIVLAAVQTFDRGKDLVP